MDITGGDDEGLVLSAVVAPREGHTFLERNGSLATVEHRDTET